MHGLTQRAFTDETSPIVQVAQRHSFTGVAREPGCLTLKLPAYLLILCFERRCPKQNIVAHSCKLKIFTPNIVFVLATLLGAVQRVVAR